MNLAYFPKRFNYRLTMNKISFFLILFFTIPLYSQTTRSSIPARVVTDVSHTIQGTARTFTSPLRWQKKDWVIFSSILAGTAALTLVDKEVNDFLLRNRSETADKLTDVGNEYGEPRTIVIVTGAAYAIGLFSDNDWLRETAVILTASLVPTGTLQTATKISIGRARPKSGFGRYEFDPFRNEESHFSFFSGHTLAAMSMSHVFAKRINNVPAKIVFYGLGTLSGLARMYNQDHWLSDVVIANALAFVAVNSNIKWLEQKKEDGGYAGLQWRLMPSADGVRLSLEW